MQLFTSMPDFTELEQKDANDDEPTFQTEDFVIKDNRETVEV